MTTLASAPPLGSPRLAPALGVFTELWRRQPVLAAMACIFLLAMLPTSFAMHLDARTVNGISVWVKPTKFLLSLAVYYATIAWFFACLPRAAQATRAGRFVVWSGVIVGVAEMGWLLYAAVLGVPSHFNHTSIAWSLTYNFAGVGATVLLVAMLVQARMIARAQVPGIDPVYRSAVVWGAWLAGVTTLVTAFTLAAGTGHWVGGTHNDAVGLPMLGWSRDGGDLRVAHFWALHAQQLLPLLVWLAGARLRAALGARLVGLVGAGYLAFVVFTFVQALQGRPFLG